MKNAIRALLTCLCLALSGWVLADGVPLITPGPALSASDPVFKHDETKTPSFVKYHPITLSKGSFGANVLTVTIEGKDYRFSGSMAPAGPPLSDYAKKAGLKPVSTRAWSGRTGPEVGAGTMTLVQDAAGNVLGSIDLPPARHFEFNSGRAVMAEFDRNKFVFAPILVKPVFPADPPVFPGATK